MKTNWSRRDFMKMGALTALAIGTSPAWAKAICSTSGSRPYGVQLYMFRDFLAQDPIKTIEALAAAGFKQLEMFGVGGFINQQGAPLFGLSLDTFVSVIKDNGLSVPTAHVDGNFNDLDTLVELGEKLAITHFIEPMAPEFLSFDNGKVTLNTPSTIEEVKKIATRLNIRGERFKSIGFGFGYHNHHFEFQQIKGQTIFDVLMANTDPQFVKTELDLGWVGVAGADPLKVLNQYGDRTIGCHMKDYDLSIPLPTSSEKFLIPEMARVSAPGKGSANFSAIVDFLNRKNIEHRYIEVDVSDAPWDDAKAALCHLSALN